MRRLFTTMTPLLLCVGVLGVAVGSCAPPTTPIALHASAALPSPTASRPILYLTFEGAAPPRQPQWNAVSPDGSRVTLSIPGGGATWSPDGQWIAYVGARGTELRLTNTSGESQVVFETDRSKETMLHRPMWSPDGRSIAVIVLTLPSRSPDTNSLAIIDVGQRKILGRYPLSNDVVHLPNNFAPPDKFRWSPDGRKVLISWGSAAVIYVDTGWIETISRDPIVAEWAPDGEAIYYFAITRTPATTELSGFYMKRLGQPPVTLVDPRQLAMSGFKFTKAPTYGIMVLSPTGSRLALSFGSDKPTADFLRFYDLRPGEPPALERPAKAVPIDEAVAALEWAPDERAVAVGSLLFRDTRGQQPPDVRIRLLDLATDEWKLLASWRLIDRREIYVFIDKALSWTH